MFHYTDFEALQGIIKNKELWLCSSRTMNDPLDRQHASLCVKQMVYDDSCDYFSELRHTLSKEKINSIFDQSDKIPFYTVSFCEEDNDYLWREYAKDYSGVRICLDKIAFDKCLKNLNEEYTHEFSTDFDLLSFREIKYGNGQDYIKRVGDTFLKYCNGEKKYELWLEMIIHIVSGTIKCNRYHEEKENRLLFKNIYSDQYLECAPAIYAMFNGLQKEGHKEIRTHLGLLNLVAKPKEHYALNFTDFIDADCITEIMIGKNSNTSKDDVVKLLLQNNVKKIKILKQGE